MVRPYTAAVSLLLLSTAAFAQAPSSAPSTSSSVSAIPSPQTLNAIPPSSTTVTNYYKQNVYDPSNNKVGQVSDVLVDRQGKVTALIVGVGGIAGAGAKDVAVPFDSVRLTNEGNNTRLVMNTTSDGLKNAPGYKYDRSSTSWTPEAK
jgi:sporulation protein YlmC with PRC-barrel domain